MLRELAPTADLYASRPEVKAVLAALEDYGIHMPDVNPGNVAFTD